MLNPRVKGTAIPLRVIFSNIVKVIAGGVIVISIVTVLSRVLAALAEQLGVQTETTSLVFMLVLVGLSCLQWLSSWRSRNRRSSLLRNNQCLGCEYDLTGNVSGFCPECGCQVPGVMILICEECGAEVALPLQMQGTRQDCPICKKPGDVPDFGQVDSG